MNVVREVVILSLTLHTFGGLHTLVYVPSHM